MNIPTGNVTFLFTDIEGSTKLSQDFPDMLQTALQLHHDLLQQTIESNNGFVFEIVGDAFCCSFESADDAVKAAVDAQLRLSQVNWEEPVLKIRIGIHSGNAEWNGKNYMGYITLARTARIMSSAYGEQIIISNTTYELCCDRSERIKKLNISFRDLGERRLKDVIQPIRIYQVMSPGIREDFPPLKTLDARPNNLPVQLTSFIGREKEISDVKKLLGGTRLLTLLGPGGTGKTRLSLQTAADLIDEFENGVWIIELAALLDPFLLPNLIMETLGIMEEPGKTSENILINNIKKKEILLILDNCEHLIEACSALSEKLLQNSQKMKIIATSREALRCEGEITHKVMSLSHPDPAQKITPVQLSEYEAVRLFIERAIAVNPNFRVNNENAPALAQICFQLDGIPLAIELAAVRIKVLPVEKICEKLDDRFRLLTGGRRTALPRQQTLKALIDWSYGLLTDEEKIFWRRLSVFSGGWTLMDAEEICSDELLNKYDILELTNSLVEKSIVLYMDITGRYKMLETIKQYGYDILKDYDEDNIFRNRHLDYYLNLCEEAIPELSGAKARSWFRRFDEEYPNIQSALNRAIEVNLNDKGHRLAGAMIKYWDFRGYLAEASNWHDKLLQNTEGVSQLLIANTNRNAGMFATQQGKNLIAVKFIEESLRIYRELDDLNGLSISLNTLGLIESDLGNYKKSRSILEENLKIKRELNQELGISSALNSLGLIELAEGDLESAEKYFIESFDIAKKIENDEYIGIGLNNLGQVYAIRGDYEKSKIYFDEGLKIDREVGNKNGMCISLINIGILALQNADYKTAQKYLEEAFTLSREIGNNVGHLYSLVSLGQLSFKKEEMIKSKKYFEDCLLSQSEFTEIKSFTLAVAGIAEIKLVDGEFETAVRLMGALKAKLDSLGAYLDVEVNSKINEILNAAELKIGKEKTSEEFEKGKSLSDQDAIELAVR